MPCLLYADAHAVQKHARAHTVHAGVQYRAERARTGEPSCIHQSKLKAKLAACVHMHAACSCMQVHMAHVLHACRSECYMQKRSCMQMRMRCMHNLQGAERAGDMNALLKYSSGLKRQVRVHHKQRGLLMSTTKKRGPFNRDGKNHKQTAN